MSAVEAGADDSSSDDDVPLSQRLAATATPIVHPAASSTAAEITTTNDDPPPAPAPAPAAGKRKRAAPAAKPAKQPSSKATAVSGRAARGGAGGWDLSEASGDLDAEYETLGVLGRGNFSEINLVRHRKTLELRALKFCCKLDAPSLVHLKAEAKLAGRIHHPMVLTPLATADSPGRAGNFSVLLPLCPGGDLLQLLKRQEGSALAEDAARAYGAMIVLALTAIHEAGLCYRDLKVCRCASTARATPSPHTEPTSRCLQHRCCPNPATFDAVSCGCTARPRASNDTRVHTPPSRRAAARESTHPSQWLPLDRRLRICRAL